MSRDQPRRLSREGVELAESVFQDYEYAPRDYEYAPRATVYLLAEISVQLEQIREVLVDLYTKQDG